MHDVARAPMNLSDWIERHAGFAPQHEALRFDGESIGYRALAGRVARAAGALKALGVEPGAPVAWLGQNHPRVIELLFACARIGAILVPLNWRLATPEHMRALADCTPSALFAEARFAQAIGTPSGMARVAIGEAVDGWQDGDALLDAAEPLASSAATGTYDLPALLCYTSGSTGTPKGVVLTQRALFYNAVNSTQMHDLTRADRVLTTLPLFHVGGLCIQTLPALHAGATVVLHAKFDASATLGAIASERITLTVLVPAQIDMLIAHADWAHADLSSLRAISTGSMVVPERSFRGVHARGVPLIQVYGSTETGPIATYMSIADADRKAGSAGKPAVHCALRIIGDDGREVPAGRSGEILVQGPNLMSGYWNAPSATQKALDGGWYHSGDIGHFDDEGFLWVDGRRNDLIISGGENIYPAEIENVLAESPAIAEVAVVGRPGGKWGETVVAVIVPRDGCRIEEKDVHRLLDGRIARFKHPREVVFVSELPRSALGKVRRDELRRLVCGEAVA
jgi:fatty-acyl-CoA synthase